MDVLRRCSFLFLSQMSSITHILTSRLALATAYSYSLTSHSAQCLIAHVHPPVTWLTVRSLMFTYRPFSSWATPSCTLICNSSNCRWALEIKIWQELCSHPCIWVPAEIFACSLISFNCALSCCTSSVPNLLAHSYSPIILSTLHSLMPVQSAHLERSLIHALYCWTPRPLTRAQHFSHGESEWVWVSTLGNELSRYLSSLISWIYHEISRHCARAWRYLPHSSTNNE